MERITLENQGSSIAILRLSNGITNAIDAVMVSELAETSRKISKEFEGMVLAGGEKFFSIGFDLPSIISFNRSRMSDFFTDFNNLVLNLYTMPIPTCCAIAGHATAGGGILALAGDYRVIATGKKFIGLNEIKLGVPVPYLADLILRQIINDRAANKMLYTGEFIMPSEAKEIGLVDDIYPQEALERKAIETVSNIAALPRAAFSAIKANRTENIRLKYQASLQSANETFLDLWFSEPVRERLKEAAQKF